MTGTAPTKRTSRPAHRPVASHADPHLLLGALIAIAVAVPTFSGGGFDNASRSIFIVLSGAALLAAAAIGGRAAAAAASSPLALTLVALAALSVASVAWTIDGAADALRSGMVIGGYAAVLIAAATLARRFGSVPIAAGVAIMALIEAILGLGAVAFHALPDAERIVLAWQPGGTFEYPPALAILEVGSLSVLSWALSHRSRPVAGAAGVAIVLAGAVLRLADSRLASGLAAVLLLALVLRPPTLPRAQPAALATGTRRLAPRAADSGRKRRPDDARNEDNRRGRDRDARDRRRGGVVGYPRLPPDGRAKSLSACVGALVALLAATAALALAGHARSHGSTRGLSPSRVARVGASDVFHGRTHEWLAAVDTWMDHPWLGAGADAYYTASLPHQTVARSRFAHDLPLELAAELGVLGLLLGIAIYVASAWKIAGALRTPTVWLLGPTAAAFLASNLVDWTWHLAGLAAIWAAASGGLGAAEGERSQTGPRPC